MIANNIKEVQTRIAKIARNCGRNPFDVRLVAVSKRFPVGAINEAFGAGQLLFGENYIQEAAKKHEALDPKIKIHFIGHLQTNKAKTAAQISSMIETVDRLKLAKELNKHLYSLNKHLDILVQVNIGLDDKKSGITAEETAELLVAIKQLPMVHPRGLMTMPPFTENPEDARPYFRKLRQLSEKLKDKKLFSDNDSVELSMGMTNDYHVAIEEGATLVRIGTAIFGQRPAANLQ